MSDVTVGASYRIQYTDESSVEETTLTGFIDWLGAKVEEIPEERRANATCRIGGDAYGGIVLKTLSGSFGRSF